MKILFPQTLNFVSIPFNFVDSLWLTLFKIIIIIMIFFSFFINATSNQMP